MIYDYVIVGGGSAGCVLANRLSADPNCQVLVLEAGRPDYWWDLFIHMPAAFSFPLGNSFYDWCYKTEPEPFMDGRKVYHARGKVLGGSSSINGMIFQRGNPMDFDKWAEAGGSMAHWDFAHCLPYFKKMESTGRSSSFRGEDGPLTLEKGPGENPLFKAFMKAASEAGYALSEDVNGFRQEGFSHFDRNIRRGLRLSSARAYFHPVKKRKNLTLVTRAQAARLLFDAKGKAYALEYLWGRGKKKKAKVQGKEFILCAGAFNSPQLLQLSGVGNKEHLEKLGAKVVHHAPGVGENLQDHLEVYIQHACKKPYSLNPALKWRRRPFIGLKWLVGRGEAMSNHFEVGGFVKSNEDVDYPNLMFHFLPLSIRYDGKMAKTYHGYQVHVGPMYSNSRGHLRIKSLDPTAPPQFVFNYLSTKEDRREWVEAVTVARNILGQKAFSEFEGGEISPGPEVSSEEEILNWVKKDAETALHPSGTCKMGDLKNDPLAVVDPNTLKVHGIDGVRVVDASLMPTITNGNIYAPVMMMAEKAADLILGNTPLAADHRLYYKSVKKTAPPLDKPREYSLN